MAPRFGCSTPFRSMANSPASNSVVGLCLVAAAFASACGDECDDVGATWCEGNTVQECYRSGGGGHRSPSNMVKSDNCAEQGLICSAELGKARCVLETARCAEEPKRDALCVDGAQVLCEPGASHPIRGKDCSSELASRYCVENEHTARCSPFNEPCRDAAPERCAFGRILTCVDQIWSGPDQSGTVCEE
jgi:hypothetical protein